LPECTKIVTLALVKGAIENSAYQIGNFSHAATILVPDKR